MLWTAAVNLNVKVIKTEVQSGLSGRHGCLDTGRDCCLTSAASVQQHHSRPGAKSMKLNENSDTPVNTSHTQKHNLNSMWHLTCKSQFPAKSINANFPSLLRMMVSHFNISDSSFWISSCFEVISTSVSTSVIYITTYIFIDVMHKLWFFCILIFFFNRPIKVQFS